MEQQSCSGLLIAVIKHSHVPEEMRTKAQEPWMVPRRLICTHGRMCRGGKLTGHFVKASQCKHSNLGHFVKIPLSASKAIVISGIFVKGECL